MALSIGQSAANLTSLPRVGVGELARDATLAAAQDFRLGQAGSGQDANLPGFRRSQANPEESRAFNAPTAALRTIDRGVSSARRIVPDVKDILDLAQQRFTESDATRKARQQAQQANAQESAARAQQAQSSLPEPATQLGRFFGQQEEGPRALGLPQNPVVPEKPAIQFSGTQPRPKLDVFA